MERQETQETQNNLLRRCVYAIFCGVGGAVASRAMLAVANILISRILGKECYGRFSHIQTTVNLFVTFSGLGVSATLTRYLSAAKGDKDRQGLYVRTLSRMCLLLSGLLSFVLFLFAGPISKASTGTEELSLYFRIVAATVFLASMSSVEQGVMLGFERFAESSLVQVLRCALFLLLGMIFSSYFGLMGVTIALVITHGIQVLLSFWLNHRFFEKNGIVLTYSFNEEIRTILIGFAMPAFVSGLFVLPVNWVGNAILTRYRGFGEMAIFSVALQWMAYITFIPSQLGQMRPIYTDLYMKGSFSELKKIFVRTTVATTALAALAGTVFVLGAGLILGMYGPGYETGIPAFWLMILSAVIYTAQVQTGFILQAAGRMWISLGINGIWGICLLGALWMLKQYGATGYAIAYVLAYLVILGLQMSVVINLLKKQA